MNLNVKKALGFDKKNRIEKAASGMIACCLFALLLFAGCATVIAPTGGEPDAIPPKIDTLKSTPNFQTNFKKQRIELKFNEWIKLNDVFNQVVVSPPLEAKDYEVSLKGKTVRFDFSEEAVLRENATYSISFGDAIQDLTKSNKAEDIRFVFSTGDVIDSLEVTGKIIDAFTGEPVENALFMLYDNLEDSVVKTEFPLYFGQTGESGYFKIQNVRAGSFKGFALKEEVGKYKYDQPTEQIGFPDSLIVISDSSNTNIEVQIFQEILPFKLKEDNADTYGKVSLLFNQPPENLELTYDEIGQKVYQVIEGDSIRFWYNLDSLRSWKIYLRQDTILNDTIKIRSRSEREYLEENPFRIQGNTGGKLRKKLGRGKKSDLKKTENPSLPPINQNPTKPVVLKFNRPIDLIDASKIQLLEDTSKTVIPFEVLRDTADFQNLIVNFQKKELLTYELVLNTGALTDWFGAKNDSIVQPINVLERKSFGNILLSVTDLDSLKGYVIQLLDNKDKLEKEFIVVDSKTFKTDIKFISPSDYSIRMIEDLNKNGRWDPGNYESKKQPEKVFLKKIEKLRANWDVEVNVSANSFLAKAERLELRKEEVDSKKE